MVVVFVEDCGIVIELLAETVHVSISSPMRVTDKWLFTKMSSLCHVMQSHAVF